MYKVNITPHLCLILRVFSVLIIIVDDDYICCQELMVSSSGAGRFKQWNSMGNYQYVGQDLYGNNVYQHTERNERFLQCYDRSINKHWMVIKYPLTFILNLIPFQIHQWNPKRCYITLLFWRYHLILTRRIITGLRFGWLVENLALITNAQN